MKFFILPCLIFGLGGINAQACFTSVVDTSTYTECHNENSLTKTSVVMPVVDEGAPCASYVCALTSPTPASCQTSGGADILTASATLGSIDVSYSGTDDITCTTTLTCSADNGGTPSQVSRVIEFKIYDVDPPTWNAASADLVLRSDSGASINYDLTPFISAYGLGASTCTANAPSNLQVV